MDLIDRLRELAAQIPKQQPHIKTEEATKTAFVMPFINALGYNVFDPTEVVPEFTADVGTKKGEKVDYAIFRDGVPILLFEAKCCGVDLEKVAVSQLFRYFSVSEARFGILTDGVIYRFYSDLNAPNKMDEKPFFIFNLLDFDASEVEELKKFSKSVFDVDDILSTANELMFTREIKNLLAAEFANPSEDFVRLFASQVYTRRLTQSTITKFTDITKQAFRAFVNERLEQTIKSALDQEKSSAEELPKPEETEEDTTSDTQIVTTQDERDAYLIVKAILRQVVDVKRVAMRDVRSYCSILLDDNNRRPICRLHFNTAQKYLGLFDENRHEEKIPIDDLDNIYEYAERLKTAVARYITE